jgi:hypothetical protein
VQERFQAVLKRRLQSQFESHPPLFPWETQITDYPECADEPVIALVPTWGWTNQQFDLDLPMPLPDSIFRQLLEKCQALLTSPALLGPKLIQAVEGFFPKESRIILNELAGLVLTGATRSKKLKLPSVDGEYSHLQPRQQMLLSLLAAKQLFESLTLSVSSKQPLERQWLTRAGRLNLSVEYHCQQQVGKLRVQGELPSQGVIKLQGKDSFTLAETSTLGALSVELNCVQPNETYTLTIQFKDMDQQPLLFAIIPTE